MTDDAKRDGLIAFCEQGKDCEPATPWEEGYMAAMRVVVQHIKSAAPASAQTPAGEREGFERWAAALDEPRYENGDYKNDHVQTQWEAWQAALFAGDRS